MDQDLWLKALFCQGPSLLNSIVNDTPLDIQNISKKQKIHRFIKNKHDLLFKERTPVFNEISSFNPLPVELFWDCSLEQRRKLFFKNLERGEILILKVINDGLPENYKLQVLAKHQCCMKLDDLSLVMYLPKLEVELKDDLELNKYDVIRAAVWSCSIHERKLFVTLSNSIIEDQAEPVKLGKISINELPTYVGDIQIQHSCYKAYYHQTSTFKDPNWAKQLYDVLDFKRNSIYSFYKEWNEKECPATESGKYLKRKHTVMLSHTHYSQAVEYYENQDFDKAIVSLNQALSTFPNNKRALVARGTLYANTNNLRKAFFDTELALKIDPLFEPAQKQMSVILVAAAKTHIEQNDIEQAKESLRTAITLDMNNEEAATELVKIEQMKEVKQIVPAVSPVASTSSEVSTISKKKKKKHRKSHERDGKRKSRHYKSKSKSPKKRKH